MATKDSAIRCAFLLLTITLRLDAQVVETPVPFDSAGRVRSLTPALVARFDLKPPIWPVAGDFLEARLYSVSTGGIVLAVERPSGQMERYTLGDEEVSALRGAIHAMSIRVGGVVAERPEETADVSRGAFLRNQVILSAALYAPLVASLANDGQTASALYLLSTGGSFFIINNVSKNTRVTRPQNDLATDGAIRGYGAVAGLLYAFGPENIHRKTYSALGLAGALGGSWAGFRYGRRVTSSEAESAKKGSTLAAAAMLGTLGTFGVFEDGGDDRVPMGAVVFGGLTGYVLGPAYSRRAGYTVTAGDVRTLPVGAVLGAMVGLTPFLSEGTSAQPRWGGATLGGITGIWLADRAWVRPFDYSGGDVTLLWLGTIAGGLMGAAVAVLTESDDPVVTTAMVTIAGLFGAAGGHGIAKPAVASRRGALRDDVAPKRLGDSMLELHRTGLVFALSGVPGRYPLLSARF